MTVHNFIKQYYSTEQFLQSLTSRHSHYRPNQDVVCQRRKGSWADSTRQMCVVRCSHNTFGDRKWLKCKEVRERYIQVWAPDNGRVPFFSIITIWGGGTLWAINWRWGNGVPLRPITL